MTNHHDPDRLERFSDEDGPAPKTPAPVACSHCGELDADCFCFTCPYCGEHFPAEDGEHVDECAERERNLRVIV